MLPMYSASTLWKQTLRQLVSVAFCWDVVADELIVFLAKERRGAPAGERGSPTPSTAKSVEKKLQHILVNLDEMATAEGRSILKRNSQR